MDVIWRVMKTSRWGLVAFGIGLLLIGNAAILIISLRLRASKMVSDKTIVDIGIDQRRSDIR
jgi:hypothetical protein